MHFTRTLLLAGTLAAATLSTALAQAQTYPARAITVIVPYAPGGNTDVVARIVTEHMSRTLGQQLVIENSGGAGGTTASGRASRSEPNGYTLLVGQMGTHAASVGLYPKLAYDPVTDFEHISQLSDTPIAILARKNFPAKDLAELIAMLKADPAKYNNGHGGVGATSHVSCLFFTSLIGARPPMIAYTGSGPALNDLVSGQYDFLCDQIPHLVQQVKTGNIKAYAVALPERTAALPDVPTTREAGLPEFQASGWNAMFAPKGTPREIVERLSRAVNAALEDPATSQKLIAIGAELPRKESRSPDGLRAFVQSEIAKWTPIMKAAAGGAK
ncbi:MAG: tripartite tricarboxylate transporter family receptor [Hyphomicrobiales bacterium]|nr:tripartite tricarboxylate transporter family receptor [Hyphomicrobiales bacterium]